MGEIINFPGTDKPIFELDPTNNDSFDAIIDEARFSGSCLYQCEGKMYELKLEDLDGQNSQQNSSDTPQQD